MSRSRLVVLAGLTTLIALSCKGDDEGTIDPVGDGDDDDGPGPGDTDTPPVAAPFGLDERPANPTCVAPARPLDDAQARLTRVYAGVSFSEPIWLGTAPGVAGWWYVVEKDGRVLRFPDDPAVAQADVEVVVDLRARVDAGYSESGLLGMAFHPDFAVNGEVFLSYTADGDPLVSRIVRVVSPDGGATFDGTSEEILLSLAQPEWNHNGGHVAFGPDGYLYIGFGDGGSGGDPWDNGQDTSVLLGKMLRIDVDTGDPYGIPADNPFADGVGGRPEIFAWGLRNPWRWSFDAETGDLYVGDVGQNELEEVDLVERGGNYGWNVMEGPDCYDAGSCNLAGLELPLASYPNTGGASVTGGVVYYGSELPELSGVFLYADFAYGDLYGLMYDPVTGLPYGQKLIDDSGRNIGHFATGPDGEVYLMDFGGGVYQLERVGAALADPFPATLSATGCVDASDPSKPASGVIPYDLNLPFWSDGAEKERFLAIPDGTTITVGDDGDWDLPIGSVLMKHFRLDGALVETRLYVRHDDGEWAGYAYAWRADGTDADLLAGGKDLTVAGQEWSIPDRGECLRCHTVAAGGSLGLETQQLNRDVVYTSTNRASNQLATLDHIGMFAAAIGDPATLPSLPALDGSASDEEEARAWLHVNCSICHRPGGNARSDMDLRLTTALADMDVCRPPEHGNLDVPGSEVITPGDPAASVLSLRVHTRDLFQMPPVGTNVVDAEGATIVDDWIRGLTSCP